jgi:hypothetical protein
MTTSFTMRPSSSFLLMIAAALCAACVFAQAPATVDCNGNPAAPPLKLNVTNDAFYNVEVRLCQASADVCTPTAGKWNSFHKCPAQIFRRQNAILLFDSQVTYMSFLNVQSLQTVELWQNKDGTWPVSYAINV